jgi:two-component system cell cycle response regulator DivK
MQQVLVLLVEDNRINAKVVEIVLEHAGYQVVVAQSAEEGLSLARAHRPALVLMDIQLPGVDGLAALRELRQDARTQTTKVIAITAMARKSDRELFLSAGFDGYVSKPFKPEELVEAVKAVLTH